MSDTPNFDRAPTPPGPTPDPSPGELGKPAIFNNAQVHELLDSAAKRDGGFYQRALQAAIEDGVPLTGAHAEAAKRISGQTSQQAEADEMAKMLAAPDDLSKYELRWQQPGLRDLPPQEMAALDQSAREMFRDMQWPAGPSAGSTIELAIHDADRVQAMTPEARKLNVAAVKTQLAQIVPNGDVVAAITNADKVLAMVKDQDFVKGLQELGFLESPAFLASLDLQYRRLQHK